MQKNKRKKGQAIVEMAILFPVFLLVIVGGIVDFGFAFYNMLALQQVANDSSFASAERNLSEAQTLEYISNYSTPPVGWHNSGIYTVSISTINMTDGSNMKKVELEYNSKVYTPFYQTIVNTITGNDYLVLKTQASYKIPNNIRNREHFGGDGI